MVQRILNVGPTPQSEIKVETIVSLDRTLILPSRKLLTGIPLLVDQGSTGTCVAHAAYGLYNWWFKRKYGHFAPLDIMAFYDLCKIVDHDPDPERTHGTLLLTALRTMAGSGYPFIGGGRGPKIIGYEYIGDNTADVKLALAQHSDPVLFRVDWDANWMTLPYSRILKAPVGQIIGGHAMYDYGYDDNINGASDIERNSWGRWSTAGNGGCYMRDAYKDSHRLEAWRVTGIL